MIQKLKKNDKGFTLVELIVVIAILGVLMAVLVPQYIQYVEKSRIGVDESYIGEVAHVMELTAASSETVSALTTTVTVTVSTSAITVTAPATGDAYTDLTNELTRTFGAGTAFKSKAYKTQTITISMTGGKTSWTKVSQATPTVSPSPSV